MNDEVLICIIWDISKWCGEKVYIIVVDSSIKIGWGYINFDDFCVGDGVFSNGYGLIFNIMG